MSCSEQEKDWPRKEDGQESCHSTENSGRTHSHLRLQGTTNSSVSVDGQKNQNEDGRQGNKGVVKTKELARCNGVECILKVHFNDLERHADGRSNQVNQSQSDDEGPIRTGFKL